MSNEETIQKIIAGCELAFERLVERTIKEDGYLVVSQNGKIVKLKGEELKKLSK